MIAAMSRSSLHQTWNRPLFRFIPPCVFYPCSPVANCLGTRRRITLRLLIPLLWITSFSLIPGPPLQAQPEPPLDLSDVIVTIPIEGPITARSCRKVQRDIEDCVQRGAQKIVFSINTMGGDYEAASQLSGAIYDLRNQPSQVRTWAYIGNSKKAISAGALIAFSCESLIMGDKALVGDVEPRNAFGKPLDEKIQSVVRSDLLNYAKSHPGWPLALVEAMVTKELVVYEVIQRNQTGEIKQYVLQGGLDSLLREDSRLEYRIVNREGELETLDVQEAFEYGFINKIYPSYFSFLEDAGIREQPLDVEDALGRAIGVGKTGLVAWFADNPFPSWAKFLLILFGVVGLVLELKIPGLLLGGSVFLLCFTTFFLEGFATQYVGWVEIIFFPLAVILLATEIFVVPGFGIPGISGIALLFASLSMALIPEAEGLNWSNFSDELLSVMLALAGSILVTLLVLRLMPGSKTTSGGGLISTTSLTENSVMHETGTTTDFELKSLIGKKGTVAHALRPAGKIELEGRLHDVVAIGEFIPKGVDVVVVEVEGNRIGVQSVDEQRG